MHSLPSPALGGAGRRPNSALGLGYRPTASARAASPEKAVGRRGAGYFCLHVWLSAGQAAAAVTCKEGRWVACVGPEPGTAEPDDSASEGQSGAKKELAACPALSQAPGAWTSVAFRGEAGCGSLAPSQQVLAAVKPM